MLILGVGTGWWDWGERLGGVTGRVGLRSGPEMWDWEEGLGVVTGTWAWVRRSHFAGWVPTGRCRTNALKRVAMMIQSGNSFVRVRIF